MPHRVAVKKGKGKDKEAVAAATAPAQQAESSSAVHQLHHAASIEKQTHFCEICPDDEFNVPRCCHQFLCLVRLPRLLRTRDFTCLYCRQPLFGDDEAERFAITPLGVMFQRASVFDMDREMSRWRMALE